MIPKLLRWSAVALGAALIFPFLPKREERVMVLRVRHQPNLPSDEPTPPGQYARPRVRLDPRAADIVDSVSTFGVDVDTGSYSLSRRMLMDGVWPDPESVRVEEFINYFRYDYDPPEAEGLFSIQVDGSASPFDGTKHLLRLGIQAKVIEDPERTPANLVFLVDTSCSMNSDDGLQLAKRSLEIALERLTERDRIAIATYAGGTELVLGPTSGAAKERIRAAILSLRAEGGTAMASGMELAYRQAARMRRKGSLTRVIVLSDGDANIGPMSHDEILLRIRTRVRNGITMSTVGFGKSNYRDKLMEQLADRGNGNYWYVDSEEMAGRVFGRDFTKMVQDVAQDVKVQVEFDPAAVRSHRIVGYENRAISDPDFRSDRADGGEVGAGHHMTALIELELSNSRQILLGKVRVRAKKPGGIAAKEIVLKIPTRVIEREFSEAPDDLRFAVAVMRTAELLQRSPYVDPRALDRVLTIADGCEADRDREEFIGLLEQAKNLADRRMPKYARAPRGRSRPGSI